ncbi:hypothetical protein [Desulfatitalea alkaliphila]|uniref:Uncharacterized protein n=1 Tax=Desulfatitalea alkaliphila TaxID=2929485 RepID=A0AA41R8R2_9BACT|nr:hypothetical protein [Desulfatitalea alkaliphila]MCJ8503066.1 hypothetical protein [Desulfatitalea alkaliphila]
MVTITASITKALYRIAILLLTLSMLSGCGDGSTSSSDTNLSNPEIAATWDNGNWDQVNWQ